MTVFTRWQDVFAGLPIAVKCLEEIDRTDLRSVAYSEQSDDMNDRSTFARRCVGAGIKEPVALRIDWRVRNTGLLDDIRKKAGGRRVFIYQPRKAVKNDAMALLQPERGAFNTFVDGFADHFRVKLGYPPYVEDDAELPCELDLFGKGNVCDTLDVCTLGDAFFSEPSFLTCIAEALDKPAVCMFTRRAMNSDTWVRNITPTRIFHKQRATAVYDE